MLGLLGTFLGHIYGGWWPGLLISVLLAAFNVFGLVTTTLPYLRGQQSGVSTLSVEQVVGMKTVTNEFQIYKIAGSQMVDTGVYQTASLNRSEFSRSYYGLLVVGDRLLVVNTIEPVDETVTAYRGHFNKTISEEIMGLLAPDLEGQQGRLLPVYFTEQIEGPNTSMEFFISVQVLLLLISIFGLWRFLTVTVFPEPETPKAEKPGTEKPKIEKPKPAPQSDPAPQPKAKVDSVPARKPLKKL